jgi:hypothetical protein
MATARAKAKNGLLFKRGAKKDDAQKANDAIDHVKMDGA